jgi:hypothetical protein
VDCHGRKKQKLLQQQAQLLGQDLQGVEGGLLLQLPVHLVAVVAVVWVVGALAVVLACCKGRVPPVQLRAMHHHRVDITSMMGKGRMGLVETIDHMEGAVGGGEEEGRLGLFTLLRKEQSRVGVIQQQQQQDLGRRGIRAGPNTATKRMSIQSFLKMRKLLLGKPSQRQMHQQQERKRWWGYQRRVQQGMCLNSSSSRRGVRVQVVLLRTTVVLVRVVQ